MHRTYSISPATVPITQALVRGVPWPCSHSSARVPGAAAQPVTWPHGPASGTGMAGEAMAGSRQTFPAQDCAGLGAVGSKNSEVRGLAKPICQGSSICRVKAL